jgi:hypothetical protein
MIARTVWVVYKSGDWIIDGPDGYHKCQKLQAIIAVYPSMEKANEAVCGPGQLPDDPKWLISNFAPGYTGRWGDYLTSSVEVQFFED